MRILLWMSGSLDRRTPSEHLLTAIIEALYADGHTVHIIQKDTKGELPLLPESLAQLGVTTVGIPIQQPKKNNFVKRYLADVAYAWKCKNCLKRDREYNAVFLQSNTVAGFVMYWFRRLLPNARFTYNVQDIFPYNAMYAGQLVRNGIAFKVLAAIQRYGYRKADQIITISEDMKDLLIEDGVESEKIEVIYNWSYQDEIYQPEQMHNEVIDQMLTPDKFNVVYAGNIGVMQNVDVIVETAKLMRNDDSVHFHIIGDGIYKKRLVKQADGLKNISFWPMLPSQLAPYIYCTADVNIIPLGKDIYRTALPSKTATCLACGKPVVFAVGRKSRFGVKLEKETGCPVVECDAPEDLKDKLLLIRDKKDQYNTVDFYRQHFGISENSMKYAERIASVI